jgi:hypothetical protein
MPKPKGGIGAEFSRKPWQDLRRRGDCPEKCRSSLGYFLDPWTAIDYLEAFARIERELLRLKTEYGERAAKNRFASMEDREWIERILRLLKGAGR